MGSHLNFKNFGHNPSGEGNGARHPTTPLVRQSSVYSLTFDEFQNTWGGGLGKDFGSMNMDELLKNIWTAEETQAMVNTGVGGEGSAPAGSNLTRQGSLTLPRTLSQKTVDEVWKDLFKDCNDVANVEETKVAQPNLPQWQRTLGEMTLEEFLMRAGVVREDPQQTGWPNCTSFFGGASQLNNNNASPAPGFLQSNQNNELYGNHKILENNNNLSVNGVGIRSTQQQQPILPKPTPFPLPSPMNLVNGATLLSTPGVNNNLVGKGLVGLVNAGVTVATESPVKHMSPDIMVKGSVDNASLSPVPYVFGRGRRSGAALEKVIERRQKRMIKNRESAARSRARKQAYTTELEAEVAKLKEMNQELQSKQGEMLKMQKNQVRLLRLFERTIHPLSPSNLRSDLPIRLWRQYLDNGEAKGNA